MRKLTLKRPKFFKGLNAPYRMVFINEASLDEVASFHLTKKSVYGLFSTLFVVTIVVTVSILLFTPLKFYIPGYGSNAARTQVIGLQQTVDSLGDLVKAQQQQAENIQRIISGKDNGKRDTTMLKPELIKEDAINSILPKTAEIRQTAAEEVKQEKKHRKRK